MSSIFPFVDDEENGEEEETLPVYKEFAYDFQNNCLLKKGGKFYLVERNDAIKIWLFFLFQTERFKYPAYTHDYGHDLKGLYAEVSIREIWELEAERLITEAVIVNPYIQEVYDFSFEYFGSKVSICFLIDTIYDKISYEMEIYNE